MIMSEYLETYGLRAVLPISPERAHIGSQATPGNIPMNVLPLGNLRSVLPTGGEQCGPLLPQSMASGIAQGRPQDCDSPNMDPGSLWDEEHLTGISSI